MPPNKPRDRVPEIWQSSGRLPDVGEGKRGEDGHIGYLVRQASAAMKQSFERVLRPIGLTHPQYVVLAICSSYGARSGTELAQITHLTPQTITVITRNLVRVGYLTRQPDPRHAKVVRFAVSSSGQQLLNTAREKLEKVESSFTEGFTPAQILLVRAWLVSVARMGDLKTPKE